MFEKLLVPLDGSALAEQAIPTASAIARITHASIELVMVEEPSPFGGDEIVPWRSIAATPDAEYLKTIAAELRSGASLPITVATLRGRAAEVIAARANEIGAGLIVMTSHGRTGLSRAWLGSVADAVVRTSAIPVLMLRPVDVPRRSYAARFGFKRVIVPLDGSTLSADILGTVAELAAPTAARVALLRVVPPVPPTSAFAPVANMANLPFVPDDLATRRLVDEAKRDLEEVAGRLRERTLLDVTTEVAVSAHVADAIVDFARDHSGDLIAMSTHGRGASRWLVGSVADKVLRASGLPVLLRRPAGVVREERALLSDASLADQLPALSGL